MGPRGPPEACRVSMQRIVSPRSMQRLALVWREEGRRIGFVPTMGALHAGHLSLVARARRRVGTRGRVVVSIYVNPTQFGPTEDLSRYPRDLAGDLRLCREAGVDAVFVPTDATMYPGRGAPGGFSTYVMEEVLTAGMEGTLRPTHFRGVTTVVAKLFLLVQPHVAVFGAKDWQQAMVVNRMTVDLGFPVRVEVAPTVREPDGLAMSSRNRYLDEAQRRQATVLWRSIQLGRRRTRHAGVSGLDAAALAMELRALIESEPQARVDYVAFFDGRTLVPVGRVRRGTHLALAVRLGSTRLIDNARL